MKKILLILSLFLVLILNVIYLVLKTPKNIIPNDNSASITNNTNDYEIKIEAVDSIDQIFSDHNWVATLSAQNKVTLIATGDVGMGRSVNTRTVKYQDWKWPWLKTADYLKSADITLINLDAPLIKNCPVTDEGMIFCADASHIEGLKFAGVDIASTANNHYANYKIDGVNESNNLLILNDIISIQNAKIKPINKNGLSFVFLNYNEIGHEEDGVDWADDKTIKSQVSSADKIADIVIVSFHWGNEYTTEITDRQKGLAHLAIDSGADLIIGNHAHWIQPLEIYKDKLIMYAHGNFIFDQMWSQETREGVVGKYTFYNKKLVDVEYSPIQIDDYGQPHFVEGEQKERMLKNLHKISHDYQTQENLVH